MKKTRLTPGLACFKVIASLLIVFTVLGHSFSQECINCNPDSLSGLYPSVMGSNTQALGNYSFAGGFYSQAKGSLSFAFGNRAIVDGSHSTAIGMFVRTIGTSLMVFGNGFSIDQPLVNDTYGSLMIGFGSTKPTFFVGPSIGANNTGKVGIGNVTDPQAKLHIRADHGFIPEHATLRLEATAANTYARIYFGDAHHITAANMQNMKFSLPADRSFIFENGSVGIGTDTPEATLHVNGDFQVGDAENPQEIRLHGSINASGSLASAFGYGNDASGAGSTVIGFRSAALAQGSIAIGKDVQVHNNYSIVIGSGISDTRRLINDRPQSLMIGFKSEVPTLFVSQPESEHQTGRIAIGNAYPVQAKLHIRADEVEDATLRLEATGSGKHARMYFTGEHHITAGNDDDFRFRTSDGRNFIFQNGDIYMEDINFGIIMKSPNGKCWRGVMTDNGTLSFSQANCPGEAAAIGETSPASAQFRLFPNPATQSVNIEFRAVSRNSALAIFTADGSFVTRIPVNSLQMEVSLSGYKSGAYIVQYEQNGIVVSSKKLLVQ